MTRDESLAFLLEHKVVAVVRMADPAKLMRVVEAVERGDGGRRDRSRGGLRRLARGRSRDDPGVPPLRRAGRARGVYAGRDSAGLERGSRHRQGLSGHIVGAVLLQGPQGSVPRHPPHAHGRRDARQRPRFHRCRRLLCRDRYGAPGQGAHLRRVLGRAYGACLGARRLAALSGFRRGCLSRRISLEYRKSFAWLAVRSSIFFIIPLLQDFPKPENSQPHTPPAGRECRTDRKRPAR
jgi:hypothetical protein